MAILEPGSGPELGRGAAGGYRDDDRALGTTENR
jgi:hypothetical protein